MVVFVSDCHIYDDSNLSKWREFLGRVCEVDTVIFGGDTFDPWKASWDDIKQTRSWGFFQSFCSDRACCGQQTIVLRGNHDHRIPKILGAILKNRHIITYPECEYEFVHGWQRDASWRWPLSVIAFFIADHLPFLMLPIHRALFGPTPSEEKADISLFQAGQQVPYSEDWNLHSAIIHDLWRDYAKSKKRRVVLGHTHMTAVDDLIANPGSFEDGTWLEINRNEVRLHSV